MEVRFLGKVTTGGDSPTLFATDRSTYIIQGWVVTNPEILAKLDIPEDETCVEVYAQLFAHLTKDGLSGIVSSWTPPIVHVLPNGNVIVQGTRVTNSAVRATMAMPDNEDCVEVTRVALVALLQEDNPHGVDDPGTA